MSSATSRTPLRTAGLVVVAATVIPVNAGLVAVHLVIGGVAWAIGAAATGLRDAGVSPASPLVAWMRGVGARARNDRSAAKALIGSASAAVAGRQHQVPSRQWLSRTLIGGTARLVWWPVAAAGALGAASASTPPTDRVIARVGLLASRLLQRWAAPGLLPGAVGQLAIARTQRCFCRILSSGSDTMLRNAQGMGGGLLALLCGDPVWLADGMHRLRGAADYVHEKERHGELGPRSRMPFSRAMVQSAADLLEAYPPQVVEVMRRRGFVESTRAYWSDRARVHRMLTGYVVFTGYTIRDVSGFFTRGLLDAGDAQALTLCELAVMTSALPDDQKDAALLDVQATAPCSIIEFEHYVGLVLPWDASPADRAIRRSASGAPLDTHTMVPSIFDAHTVHLAQSTNTEAYALRTFLWLYRDPARAAEVNARETTRKFGPAVAARIAAEPRYPLEQWEVDALTAGGPRPAPEVRAILLNALRSRGLGDIADRIDAAPP